MTAAIAGVLGVLILQTIIALAGRAGAGTANGRTVYGIIWPGKIIFLLAILLLGGLPVALLARGDGWGAAMLLLPFFLLSVLGLPGPIVVDQSRGVSTRRWYGRAKHIAWDQISRMDWTDDMQQTVIVGTNGQKIIHTGFHAARDDFRRQVSLLATVPHDAGRRRA